jgi:hypothetical protein
VLTIDLVCWETDEVIGLVEVVAGTDLGHVLDFEVDHAVVVMVVVKDDHQVQDCRQVMVHPAAMFVLDQGTDVEDTVNDD